MDVFLPVPLLPSSLVLLVHLQILKHPFVSNNDQLDIHIFDAQKHGQRARIKMMEDLGHWLVEKIEGKNQTKKVCVLYIPSQHSLVLAQIDSPNISLYQTFRNHCFSNFILKIFRVY